MKKIICIIIAALLLSSCSRKIATYGRHTVSDREFHSSLKRENPHIYDTTRNNKYLYLKKLHTYISNRIILLHSKETDLSSRLNTNAAWLDFREKAVQKWLLSGKNSEHKKPGRSEIIEFTTDYDIDLFYIAHNNLLSDEHPASFKDTLTAINQDLDTGVPFSRVANRYSPFCQKNGKAVVNSQELPVRTRKLFAKTKPGALLKPVTLSNQVVIFKILRKVKTKKGQTYRTQRIVFTNTGEEVLQRARKLYRRLDTGLDFTWAANRYTQDRDNFTDGKFQSINKLSRYFHLVAHLEQASPGDVLRQLPVGTGYVYINYKARLPKSRTELNKMLTDKNLPDRISQARKQIRQYELNKQIRQAPLTKRNYDIFYTGTTDRATVIATVGDRSYTVGEIIKQLPPHQTKMGLEKLLADKERFINFTEDRVIFPAATKVYLRNYSDTSPDFAAAIATAQDTYICTYFQPLAEKYLVDTKSKQDYTRYRTELFSRYPITIHTLALPDEIFAKDKKEMKNEQGPWYRRIFEKSAQSMQAESFTRIDRAFADLKSKDPTKLTKNEREDMHNRHESLLDKADTVLIRAFHKSGRHLAFPLNAAEKYYSHNDLRRCREWLVQSRQARDYTPDKIISLYDQTSEEKKKWTIIEAMGYLQDPRFNPALHTILERSTQIEMQCFAIESLGRIRSKENIPILRKFYKHDIWGIRLLAGQALENITGEQYPVEMPGEENKNQNN